MLFETPAISNRDFETVFSSL